MSELTFEQMLEESLKTIRNGEVVDGTVIDVKPVSYTHLQPEKYSNLTLL